MTVTEAPEETTLEGESTDNEGGKRGRSADRDFTKHSQLHADIAEFVNANSGLEPVTPHQVKAVLLLRSDFGNSPEQKQAREQRKAEREAENKMYEGLTEDEKKLVKATKRAEENLAKSQARAAEALAKAAQLREQAEASGEDLAQAVESEQNGTESGGRRRGIGRNRG
jgi:septal ring factor EnvC (AmiA/AmiB activator)